MVVGGAPVALPTTQLVLHKHAHQVTTSGKVVLPSHRVSLMAAPTMVLHPPISEMAYW